MPEKQSKDMALSEALLWAHGDSYGVIPSTPAATIPSSSYFQIIIADEHSPLSC